MAAVLQATAARLGHRARRWARKRQGTDPESLQLESRRIYILPTRAGLIFALIVFVMLLGAMNYSNNMGFALAFLLAGTGIVSIHHCHHNLVGLKLKSLGAMPVFSGDPLQFRFVLHNTGNDTRWQLELGWDGESPARIELEPGEHRSVQLALHTHHRGLAHAPRIQLRSNYPLGLFRAWAWIDMELTGLVYPTPANEARGASTGPASQRIAGHDTSGDDDFFGMRPWRPGDPPRRIAWKAYARSGQKLVNEYRSGTAMPLWIDWESEADADPEQQIARLTRRVLQADTGGWNYGLRIPGYTVVPGRGPQQLHESLKALALAGQPEAPERRA